MITDLCLVSFKAHKSTKLALGNLTLLTGKNGAGKSSILQALLLLRQAYLTNESFNREFTANGDLVSLGRIKDIFNIEADKETLLSIILKNKSKCFKWCINYNSGYATTFSKKSIRVENLSLFSDNFQYLNGNNLISPKEAHIKNDLFVEYKNQVSKQAGQGELAIHFLSYNRNKEVPIELRHPDFKNSPSLLVQVNAWLCEIVPNIHIILRDYEPTHSVLLRFSFSGKGGNTFEYLPENVSIGVSKALPLLVAVLSSQKDSLILLENFELNLHSNSQSKIVELLAMAAQYGIQIIAETHSDHIINGILVQCKRFRTEGQGINRKNVRIYYFNRSEKGHHVETKEIVISEGEKIFNPPAGFFDQIYKDQRELFGF